jgi:DNA-binding CsgD family transcriptional regulator
VADVGAVTTPQPYLSGRCCRLIAHYAGQARPPSRTPAGLAELTEREREVLALVAEGLSNAELARTLHVSLPTAKTHVSRILTKPGARDRTQLVILAYQSGLATQPRAPLIQHLHPGHLPLAVQPGRFRVRCPRSPSRSKTLIPALTAATGWHPGTCRAFASI